MKLIKPSFEILEQSPGLQGIYKQIELAGRTCYKSLDKITDDSAEGFVNRMVASKHYAMLEHGTVYLKVPANLKSVAKKYHKGTYSMSILFEGNWYITTNFRVLVEYNWLDDLKYLWEPTEFHEKRVTVRFTTSNGIMREFTRHRSHSFAVESTRYCNYSRDKFNNELTFIIPSWSKLAECSIEVDNLMSIDNLKRVNKEAETNWIQSLMSAEVNYLHMIEAGYKPQEAREVLPLATKCDMVMTGFVSDWEHFFRLRTSIIAETGKPHPDASALADPLMHEFESSKLI